MNKFLNHIRNFAIVAHIDHGKSTLADRLLEATGTIQNRQMKEQILDSNPIERERGITIKLAPVRMVYKIPNGFGFRALDFEFSNSDYILNLIDTPGHVDFGYEVSRSLAACEGIVLVVDASQGIQAQTLVNWELVKQQNLKVIPVINKIDLPIADVEKTRVQLVEVMGFDKDEIIEISAKKGLHIPEVLQAIVKRIPPPRSQADPDQTRALVFSSVFDPHRGVVIYVRMFDGEAKAGQLLRLTASQADFIPLEVGYFTPEMKPAQKLTAGEVGFIATGLKDVHLAKAGDTVALKSRPVTPLPGYKEPKPMVFLGFFPFLADDYLNLRKALEKLHLSDSAFTYKPFSSPALGNGFHCGFLGLLHAEVIRERLSREFGIEAVATTPSVEYRLTLIGGREMTAQNASDYPDPSLILTVSEPVMRVVIFSPQKYIGEVMRIAQLKRAVMINMEYSVEMVKFTYTMPLSELILDFFDGLKSVTGGYASLDYEFYNYQRVDAVKLDILVNREKVDAFSRIVPREKALAVGQGYIEKLGKIIPRKQFEIPVQAAIGSKIIARADIKAFRKDVLKGMSGGDYTRKMKKLEIQKKGKRKMKTVGSVEIPQEAFLAVLRR